jgi:hypothetical protein
MRSFLRFGCLLSGLTFVTAVSARGQIIGVENVVGGTESPTDRGYTYGWEFFVVNGTDLRLTHLGLRDVGGDGFVDTYRVAIWAAAGDFLVRELTFSGQAGTLENGFRYLPVEPSIHNPDPILFQNRTYYIGSFTDFGPINAPAPDNWITGASADFSDYLRFDGATRATDSQLRPPKVHLPLDDGIFGPALKFETAIVPEPATYSFLASGLLFAFAVLRRHLRK